MECGQDNDFSKVLEKNFAKCGKTLESPQEEDEEVTASDLANLAKSVPGGSNVDEDNIVEWINCDANDPGLEHLTDEEIISGEKGVVSDESDEEDEGEGMQKKMSHDEALTHIEGIIKYIEEQDDSSLCDKMLLKNLRSQIKKSSFETKKQKQLTDFFAKM